SSSDEGTIPAKITLFGAVALLVIKYIRNLTVGKTVYQLHFLPLRQSGDFKEAERLRFFNSVEIRQPVED
ncbi:hypothetical protein ACFSX6_12475, partial [Hymenobacter rubripertinctus]|uniref:hypothetical protein n=1 Tax=Hymenobacter rubripertinctus TaxID=2029981 RepID=UPI003642EDCC